MKRLLPLFIALFTAATLHAQEGSSIGLRGGLANGVSVRWFLTGDSEAVEGILTFRNYTSGGSALVITALYELYNYDFKSDQLRWYYGAGPHLAMGNTTAAGAVFEIGVDGILGIEFQVNGGPISLSADWKPRVAVLGSSGLVSDEGAFTLRYRF